MEGNILVKSQKKGKNFNLIVDNLSPTFGITLKNLIRRSLISFSSSYKVFAFSVNNVKHELENVEGILESTIDISENLQNINFTYPSNTSELDDNLYVFYLKKPVSGSVCAGDLVSEENSLSISNKNLVLFKTEKDIDLDITLLVRRDYGFISKTDNLLFLDKFDKFDNASFIVLDTDFSYIEDINIDIEEYYPSFNIKREKLILNFVSHNSNAFSNFSKILFGLGEILQKISILNIDLTHNVEQENVFVSELDISKSLKSCLDSLQLTYLNDLSNYTLGDVYKIIGSDKMRLFELELIMKKYNISFKL